MRNMSASIPVLCLAVCLFAPLVLEARTFGPTELNLKDVDVYEYSYRNWDNANWSRWGSMSIASGNGTRRRVYLKFDVGELQARAGNLNKVELVLHGNLSTGEKVQVNVYRVTEGFNVGTGTYHSGEVEPTAPVGQITWNNQPAWDAGTLWSFTVAEKREMAPLRFDITRLVAGWIAGAYPNHGLVIVGANESSSSYKVVFSSSESSNSQLFPQIVVNEGTVNCPVSLWGTQEIGWGHTENARLDGNSAVLNTGGIITSQSGEHDGYSIWSGGTSMLSINSGGTSVGSRLPAGEYTVIPGLGDRLRKARVDLCIEELGTDAEKCEVELLGIQKKGWGHSVNAETRSKAVVLQTGGTIVSEEKDCDGYSIWAGGPQPVLYVPPARSGLGRVLPPGTYTVLPGLREHQEQAKVKLCFEETPITLPGGNCDVHLRGKQKAGWGHSENAQTESARLTLARGGTIVSEEGTYKGYSVWSGGPTPVLYVGPGQSGVGQTLPPGTFTVLPGLKPHESTATVDLCIRKN